MLILDEPTNHLDIDSRAALIEAINDYQGAVILVSHDKYLLDACADRLWLVDSGMLKPFAGDMDDYKKLVLEKDDRTMSAKVETIHAKTAARARGERRPVAQKASRLSGRKNGAISRASETSRQRSRRLGAFLNEPVKAAQLAKQRSELAEALAAAEEEWLALSSEMEAQGG